MAASSPVPAFADTFCEWVEALWFGERDAATARLEALVALPGEVVLAGALGVVRLLVGGRDPEAVAEAVASHLIVGRPDPPRRALIADVVRMGAPGTSPAERTVLLARHGAAVVSASALECASFLTQVEAERQGVIPSAVLAGL
ncbi:MAG: hypothetical protein ACRDY7_10815 [Acidimicrobiia bacterium]